MSIKRIIKAITHPRDLILYFIQTSGIARFFGDENYIKLIYWIKFGKRINLENPKSFSEKINWLKLYNRKPEYTLMVDKLAVKEYVADKIGKEYVIPTIGVWNTPEEIDFDSLPNQFVLKTTHGGGGGGVVICKDKKTFDIASAIAKLNTSMKADIYTAYREWPYKNVPRRIIAEKYMVDESGYELKDYKLFCFDGKVQFCKVDFDRYTDHHANYYSPDWSLLPFGEAALAPKPEREIPCPANFQEMLKLAQKLSTDISFARIDFYSIKERTYFGEITFYPASGMGKWEPVEADGMIGKMLVLPNRGGYLIDFQLVIIVIYPERICSDLADYKFFCLNGEPRLCQLITDRRTEEKIDFYDMEWKRVEGLVGLNPRVKNSTIEHQCPASFEEMKRNAAMLSKNIPFSRIDFYDVNGKCYFGEITFFPASGLGYFKPEKWNYTFGELIKLPVINER